MVVPRYLLHGSHVAFSPLVVLQRVHYQLTHSLDCEGGAVCVYGGRRDAVYMGGGGCIVYGVHMWGVHVCGIYVCGVYVCGVYVYVG